MAVAVKDLGVKTTNLGDGVYDIVTRRGMMIGQVTREARGWYLIRWQPGGSGGPLPWGDGHFRTLASAVKFAVDHQVG